MMMILSRSDYLSDGQISVLILWIATLPDNDVDEFGIKCL